MRDLGVDSFSILFSHRSFQTLAIFGGFLERSIPGKNGEVRPLQQSQDPAEQKLLWRLLFIKEVQH